MSVNNDKPTYYGHVAATGKVTMAKQCLSSLGMGSIDGSSKLGVKPLRDKARETTYNMSILKLPGLASKTGLERRGDA